MEKLNLHFNDSQRIVNSICWILSYLCWLLLTINSLVSLGFLYHEKYRSIWTVRIILDEPIYIPLQMYFVMIYFVFNISIAIILLGCIFFFVKTIFKKDNEIIIKIMENLNKYHFFPLFCGFVMFILGEIPLETEGDFKSINRAGLVISLLGLPSMIFFYINTNFNKANWMANFYIRKGVYSVLILLFWYNFCYSIFYVHIASKLEDSYDASKSIRACSLTLSIIFGLCNLIFSFYFKDILICFLNLLIYIGLVIYFYICYFSSSRSKNLDYYYFDDKINQGDGIVDIIIIALSLILLTFLIVYNLNNDNIETKSAIQELKASQGVIEVKVDKNSEQIKLIICNINLTPMEGFS